MAAQRVDDSDAPRVGDWATAKAAKRGVPRAAGKADTSGATKGHCLAVGWDDAMADPTADGLD